MARDAFKDAFAVEWTASGQHAREERYCLLGVVENRLLFVSYTLRGDRIRIISARKPIARDPEGVSRLLETGSPNRRRMGAR